MGVSVYDEYIDEVGKHEAPEEREEVRSHADAGEGRGLCDGEAGQHQASTQRRPRTALKVRPVRSGIDIAFHAENVMPCSPGIMTHACMHAWHSTALPPRVPLPPDPERVAVCNATAQRPVDEGADEVEHDDGEGELLEETVSPGPSRSLGLRLICHL